MKANVIFAKPSAASSIGPGRSLIPAVHLDPEVLSYFAARAEARGTSLSTPVNDLLRKDIELIDAVPADRCDG